MSKQAVLKTIHYADLFDYPLTAGEIKKFLPEPVDATFEEILSQVGSGPYYCLPGREEIIDLRRRREIHSQSKLKKAKKVVAILTFIPWLKLIGVTGTLAMGNSNEGDDIDLMIITASRRLWLTRGLVVAFLLLTGQYRRPGKIKDRICPNLMISEDVLEFSDRDLFTAHEIVQMKPIFERGNTYQRFLEANSWVRKFLPNAIENAKCKMQNAKLQFKIQNYLFDILESISYKLQLRYMKKKRTTETTTPSVIRFHPQDVRRRVLDEYQKRVYFRRKDGNSGLSVRGGRPNLPK